MKNILKIRAIRSIACLSLALTLTGCSLLPELPSFSFGDEEIDKPMPSIQANDPRLLPKSMQSGANTKNSNYEAHLLEWQQAKANVNKVASLVGQVSTLTAKVKSLESTQAKLTQQLNNAKNSNTQSTASTMKGYAIQLFSVPQKSQIQLSWNKAMKMHPNELSGLKRIYEEITVGNRLYYRVKAGVFNSKLQAEQLCSKIKSSGSSCIPTSFKGQSF